MKMKAKPRILYVDDEESNLRGFKAVFHMEYKVFMASSGMDALEILKENEVHLIITDQKMPEMTGVEFLKKVTPLYPDSVRMILTGYSDIGVIMEAVNECGIYRYITKPWDSEELRLSIKNAVETYNLKKENKQLVANLNVAMERLEGYAHNLEEKVRERTAELEFQRDQVQASIGYAQRIQNAIFPSIDKIKSILPDSFVLFKPRDTVSGDFYWVVEKKTADMDKVIVAAVDCTGHGVPGAFMSVVGEVYLNQIVNLQQVTEPEQILISLHEGIREALNQEETDNRDGMDMALCVIDRKNRVLEFAGAKNPLVYVEQKKEGPQFHFVKGDSWAIGGWSTASNKDFKKVVIPLGDWPTNFYIYSDGYQDQFGGARGKKFMVKNFKILLSEIHHLPMQEQKVVLEKRLEQWMNEGNSAPHEQLDDILVMGFRISNTSL